MSVVSGVTLICSLVESDDDEGADLLGALDTLLLDDPTASKARGFQEVSEHYGGTKRPQHFTFAAGINYLTPGPFIEWFRAHPWRYPENAILIIQPEDGPTLVVRRP